MVNTVYMYVNKYVVSHLLRNFPFSFFCGGSDSRGTTVYTIIPIISLSIYLCLSLQLMNTVFTHTAGKKSFTEASQPFLT